MSNSKFINSKRHSCRSQSICSRELYFLANFAVSFNFSRRSGSIGPPQPYHFDYPRSIHSHETYSPLLKLRGCGNKSASALVRKFPFAQVISILICVCNAAEMWDRCIAIITLIKPLRKLYFHYLYYSALYRSSETTVT